MAALLTAFMLGAAGCAVEEEPGGSKSGGKKQEQKAGKAKDSKRTAEKAPADSEPVSEEPAMTSGQENALRSAQSYVDMMGMSKAGLIRQLSSSAGEGYSKADATFAANNVDVDWNAEAVESAESYLEMMPMSKSGLIEQLSSSAGEQFTVEQATYAANKVY